MSSQDCDQDNPAPLKLLSLDGGGIRGLSSLIILKQLMKKVNPKNPPKPCEYFDLIGGTSTGGIIAIMLGRLRMGVDACIDKYIELSSAAFEPKRSKFNILGRTTDTWKASGTYRSDSLAEKIKNVVNEHTGDEEARLMSDDTSCRIFVSTFTKALNTPVRLRSYTTDDAVVALSTFDCRIWEAARATSAAATFFDPIKIGRQEFVDGGTGMNNPVELVLQEAVSIWPDAISRIQCLISIGTGVPDLEDFGDNLKEVIETLKAIATETEQTEQRFFRNQGNFGVGGRYFRFSVNKGLGGVGLDEHNKLDKIEAATELYLGDPRVKRDVQSFLVASPPHSSSISKEDRDERLNWLDYVDPLVHHNEARKHRTVGATGQWFLTETLEKWENQPRSFMWLHAKAGSGKTVLSSAIIDKLENRETSALAYFYFTFRDPTTLDIVKFKHSLLTQLVRRLTYEDPLRPDQFYLPRAFLNFYDKYERLFQRSKSPKLEDLHKAFIGVLNASPKTYIVIDGLDEYDSKPDRKDVVNFLEEISNSSHPSTHILFTSRREKDIEETFAGVMIEKSLVGLEMEAVNADIKTYVEECMTERPFKDWSKKLRKKVLNHLVKQADGVFRWVALQMMGLRYKEREIDVEMALKRLPKTLEESYERILQHIENEMQTPIVLAVLRWLLSSQRPLRLSEVGEIAAFVIQQHPTEPDEYSVSFDPRHRFPTPWSVRGILSGLVTASPLDYETRVVSGTDSSGGASPYQHVTIYFSHFSVKEYLQSSNAPPQYSDLNFKEKCDWFILKSCLAYIRHYDNVSCQVPNSKALESGLFDSESSAPVGGDDSESDTSKSELTSVRKSYPLLLYTCKYWWQHAVALCSSQNQTEVQTTIKRIASLMADLHGTAFKLTIEVALDSRNPSGDQVSVLRGCLTDCLTTDRGRFDVGRFPFDVGFDFFDFESPLALHLASDVGDVFLIKLLLSAGVPADTKDYQNQLPLHRAAKKGDVPVAEALIEAYPDLDIGDKLGKTALSLAAGCGHEDLVQFLLDKGATVDLRDSSADIFHFPSWRVDPYKIISLFTGWQIFMNKYDGSRTPLYSALANGHEAVAIKLLDNGCDPLMSSMWSISPFSMAIIEGMEAILRKMLAKDKTYVSTTFHEGCTALHLAAANWRHSILRILLENDADVHARDDEGKTALHFAALGLEGVVSGRAESGYDYALPVSTEDRSQRTTIGVLLEYGADVGSRTNKKLIPLHYAIYYRNVDAVQVLLEAGSDVNIASGEGWSSLHFAACRGEEAMVRLLLEKGAKVNQQTAAGVTPLHSAACHSFPLTHLLLEAGADPHMKDSKGRTPLHAAALGGQKELMDLFLKNGVSLEAKDDKGMTPSDYYKKTEDKKMTRQWTGRRKRDEEKEDGNEAEKTVKKIRTE